MWGPSRCGIFLFWSFCGEHVEGLVASKPVLFEGAERLGCTKVKAAVLLRGGFHAEAVFRFSPEQNAFCLESLLDDVDLKIRHFSEA